MIILQLLIYCLLFAAMVKIAVIGGAVNGLYFYPKTVQDQAIELGLIDRNTMNRKRKRFMISFYVVMLAALVLIIGMWNRALRCAVRADLEAGAEKAKHTGVDLGCGSGNCRRYCPFDFLRSWKLPK